LPLIVAAGVGILSGMAQATGSSRPAANHRLYCAERVKYSLFGLHYLI